MKIDRLIAIIMMLLNKKKVTAAGLAEHFGVSVRTIQRDMDNLSLAGIPIYADVGKNGGYQLMEDYSLDKNFLSTGEAKILLTFLEGLEKAAPYAQTKSMSNKVMTMLPKGEGEEKVVMNLNPMTAYGSYKDILEQITDARDNKMKLRIEYINAELYRTERIICPYTLVMLGTTWYLYAWCERANDFRMFKVSRIVDCKRLDSTYELRPMPDVKPWENNMASDVPCTKVVLELDACLKGKVPEYFDPVACHFEGDKIIVEVNFPIDEWMYSIVTSLVPYVKVREPEWFAKGMKRRLLEGLEKLDELS